MRRLILFLFLFSLVPMAFGDVTIGVDYDSIQEAVDQVDEGEVIYVPKGVFAGGVVVDKRVSIIGSDSVLLADGSPYTLQVEADGVIIRGFTFAPSYTGVIVDASGVSIDECLFMENMIGVDCLGDDISVTGCSFSDCSFTGIRMASLNSTHVEGNVFNKCDIGLILSNMVDAFVSGNTFLGCDAGLALNGVQNSTFSGNGFDGCNTSLRVENSLWNSFNENNVNGGVFLDVSYSMDNVAQDNLVQGTYAVQSYSQSNIYIFDGLTVEGDMFSVSQASNLLDGYSSISDALSFILNPDPVHGGEWAIISIDVAGDMAADAISGSIGLYDLDSGETVLLLTSLDGRLVGSYPVVEDAVYGCLMRVDDEPPIAYFDFPAQVFIGEVFYLDASGSTDNVGVEGYEWDLGNGETSIGVYAQHYYSTRGNYTVTLRVTDDSGFVSVISHEISVIEAVSVAVDNGIPRVWYVVIILVAVAGFLVYMRLRRENLP